MNNYKLLKANDAGGDLTKTWYISYYFQHPQTGQFVRFRETFELNRHKQPKGRKEALYQFLYAKRILLDNGWSPYESDTNENTLVKAGILLTNCRQAFDRALEHKKGILKKTSYQALRHRAESFLKFLGHENLLQKSIKAISRSTIMKYLDMELARGIAKRSRNNELRDLRAIFSSMIDLEIVEENPAVHIKKLSDQSSSNQIYQEHELIKIFDWMDKNDPQLAIFCRMIRYALIRPIELTRLQISDINLSAKTITIKPEKSKTGYGDTIRIMDILIPYLENMNLSKYPANHYLFSGSGKPSAIPTTRDYFTGHFARLKKPCGVSAMQTMYSLKHTSICQMIRNGANESEVRKYSRHRTSEALNIYLKMYNLELPKDLSSFLN